MSLHPTPDDRARLIAVLRRHEGRRAAHIPTVSVLVGPIGPAGRLWREWSEGRGLLVSRSLFPLAEWLLAVARDAPLPARAVDVLASRAGREPVPFAREWGAKTPADRDRFWATLAPHADDDLLRVLTSRAATPSDPTGIAAALVPYGDRAVRVIGTLVPSPGSWPGVTFVAGSVAELSAVALEAATWAERVPTLPIAVVVSAEVWTDYCGPFPDSRAKAILREGELDVPGLDAAEAERLLARAGMSDQEAAVITAAGADAELVEAAAEIARTVATPPQSVSEDDGARSAAERFLFQFLESLPETAGRFELNAALDFRFGPRSAEADLFCRDHRLVIEIDGYFHFLDRAGYRRDRTKDWELQRRGYLVLRFLAEDVISHLERIRDRILDALARPPHGGPS